MMCVLFARVRWLKKRREEKRREEKRREEKSAGKRNYTTCALSIRSTPDLGLIDTVPETGALLSPETAPIGDATAKNIGVDGARSPAHHRESVEGYTDMATTDPRRTYAVGVDVGTGSARACIIDFTGELLAEVSKEIKTWSSRADYYEQSTTDIWKAICYCVRACLEKAAVDPANVKGIGFDATCSLAVLSESTDEPVSVAGPEFQDKERNVILWMDHRCPDETAAINATGHKLLKYVGGRMSIEMEIPKVLWLKRHLPPSTFRDCKFYDLVDALTHIASGTETRSFCSTVCKQGYVPVGIDGSVKGWQEDFLAAVGLPELAEDNFKRMGGVNGEYAKNGTMLSAGELVGGLCKQAAEQLGLLEGTKIGSGVIDAYAGWIGTTPDSQRTVGAKVELQEPLLDESIPKNNLEQAFTRLAAVAGTSTCHLVMSRNPVFVPGVWGPYRDVILPDFWMAEGGQSSTGSLLNHVVTTHPSYATAKTQAAEQKISIYELLNARLEQLRVEQGAPSISYLARHIFFYGDHHGNRSPIADATMRGAIVGLSMDTSVNDLALQYYAAMEFIAQQTRHIISAMNASGHNITTIFMSGGQCRNPILMALVANATRLPVVIPRYVDAAVVLGSAMMGAKAAGADPVTGRTEGLWEIMDRLSKPGRMVHVTDDKRELALLDAKYRVFLQMSEEQQKFRRSIDAEIQGWAAATTT
ncbi:putative sugar kinase [Drechslerella dactyloides]|uniref:Sugar kinase n=1 Tax=Drechslerella dactyloides TaxID=74499 RepID=A0AAD6J1P2_DREDA|nr:putative sugar kinase [Drechslerella dactyloides]